ncbi:contactin-1-like [Ruditapes philippinarum]|uniref:contactin-1-like n=1 Tax=Ruditapes philippinarum TaxID=129788 RepID=UPI00295B9F85|nr:contactin-1-like [Ruditapes philippinarum]XP_060563637.1 contactin-1-like [Ruditapes philippinarum]
MSGENNGVVRSQILVLYPTRYMNGNEISCSVYNTENLETPVKDSAKLSIQFKPLTTTITGNNNIIANGITALTLDCTSGSSNPISDITWTINNVISKATQDLFNLSGEYGGIKRRQRLILTPTRDNDGDIVSCEAQNILGTSERIKETLDLRYRPIIEQMSNVVVVEGNNSELMCVASSKPASTFKWYKQGQQTPVNQGSGAIGNNKLPFVLINVRKQDAATYRCNANNGVEVADDETVLLTVHYPPDVTVVGSNTSIKATNIVITCNAMGLPGNNYRYGKWVQTWPGHSLPLSEKPGSKTLQLTDLTYEHSGIYTCSASNGIRVFGTDKEFIEGSAQILIKSFPIVTKFTKKVTAKLNDRLNIELEYYSNAGVTDVKVYKNVNGLRQTGPNYSLSKRGVLVDLPVFTQIVKTNGVKLIISFTVMSKKDIGYFDIVLSNEVDSTFQTVEIVPDGPPGVSKNITVDNIQQTTARVLWQQGYHGGFPQTFLIQLSTDRVQWENVETVYGGTDESEDLKQKVLTDLSHSTTYFIRIYAFNRAGNSPFSQYQNFTTHQILRSDSRSLSVGGIVGGTLSALVVIVLIVVLVVLFRRKTITKDGIRTRLQTILSAIRKQNHEQGQQQCQQTEMNNYADNNIYEQTKVPAAEIKSNDKANKINLYEKLQRSNNSENPNAYDMIKVEKETTADGKVEYENLPKKTHTTDAFKTEIAEKLGKRKNRIYENLKPGGVKGIKKK